MELRTLRYFIATVDAGSVSAAAEVVHVSQPSLSRQLRQLESALSVELFARGSGRLVLSSAGRQFLPIARDLISRAAAAELAAEAIATGRLEHIAIAAPITTLTDVIAPFLATLGPEDPVPRVLTPGAFQDQSRVFEQVDMAMMTQPASKPITTFALAVLPIWAYVRSDHPWARRDRVSLVELVDETLIVMEPEFKPHAILTAALEEEQLSLGSVLSCGNAQLALALAAAGRGVAVVSDDPRFDLVPIRIMADRGQLSIRLYAAWDPRHHAAGTLEELAHRLRAFCTERYGDNVTPD